MAKRIALAAIAVVGGVLLIFMFTRLSSADREAAAAVGRDAVTALLTENQARWEPMIVPDREPDYPEAMRRHLREMQRSVQGCRNIGAQNSVWQPLNTRDSVVFRTHFADPCVDRGTSQRCTTIGLFLRRVGARWYIDAVDRGVCLEAP